MYDISNAETNLPLRSQRVFVENRSDTADDHQNDADRTTYESRRMMVCRILSMSLLLCFCGCGSDDVPEPAAGAGSVGSPSDDRVGESSFADVPIGGIDEPVIKDAVEVVGNILRSSDEPAPEGTGRFTVTGIEGVAQLVEGDDEVALECMALSPDGSLLAAGCADGYLVLWDLKELKPTLLTGDDGDNVVYGLMFTADGRHLLSRGEKNVVWDVAKRLKIGELDKVEWINDFALIPGTKHFVSIYPESIRLWDQESKELLKEITEYDSPISMVSVAKAGDIAVHLGDGEVAMLDRTSLEEVKRLQVGGNSFNGLAALEHSPDGSLLATAEEESVSLWDAKTGKRVHALGTVTDEVNDICFSPDGKLLAAGDEDGVLTIWDVESGQKVVLHDTGSEFSLGIEALEFVGNNQLVTMTWNNIQVWPLDAIVKQKAAPATTPVRHVVAVHDNVGRSGIAFGPDGSWFVVSSTDEEQNAAVCDRATGERLFELEDSANLDQVAVSPNGQWIGLGPATYASDPGSVGIWSSASGKRVWKSPPFESVYALACLDDKRVAINPGDSSLRLIGPDQPAQTLLQEGLNGEIKTAGDQLLAAGPNGQLLAWTLKDEMKSRVVGTAPADVDEITLSPDGSVVAVRASNFRAGSTFVVWEIASGRELARLTPDKEPKLGSVIPLPEPGVLVCASISLADDRSWLVDIKSGRTICEMRDAGNYVPKMTGASPDGLTLAGWFLNNVDLYDIRDILDEDHSRAVSELLSRSASIHASNGLIQIKLSGAVSDDDLAWLKPLRRPFNLRLDEADQITDAGFTTLKSVPQLRGLDLYNQLDVTPESLQNLVGTKSLKQLRLPGECSDEYLAPVGQLTSLEDLDIGSSQVTNAGLAQIAGLKNLRSLDLTSGELDNPDLSFLAGFSSLESLELWFDSSDEQLAHVAGLKNMKSLQLPYGMTDAGFEHLANMPELTSILIQDDVELTEKSLSLLSSSRIEELRLRSEMATDDALRGLSKWQHLRVLRLSDPVSDAGLSHIAGLTTLEQLNLDHTLVTDDGMAHLAGLTRLKHLVPPRERLSGTGFAQLHTLTALEEVVLGNTEVTDEGLAGLAKIPGILRLRLPPQITDAGVKHLGTMTSLIELNLDRTGVTDAGVSHLTNLSRLEKLGLNETRVTDAALKDLAACRSLKSLAVISLVGPGVSDAAIKALKEKASNEDRYLHISD